MAIDWEAKVGAPLVAIFGEPASYKCAATSEVYQVTGVFDAQFRSSTVIDPDAPTSDRLPVFGINAAQIHGIPAQNDRITFPAGTLPHSGKAYLVRESRPDGHGIYHLVLNEAAP